MRSEQGNVLADSHQAPNCPGHRNKQSLMLAIQQPLQTKSRWLKTLLAQVSLSVSWELCTAVENNKKKITEHISRLNAEVAT